MNSIQIPDTKFYLGGDRVFLIAEIGKNFIQTEEEKSVEEYLKNAKELVWLAKKSGADAVKFQTHNVEDEQLAIDVTSPHFKGSDRFSWVTRNTNATPAWFWLEIKKYCDNLGIIFFSTPMSRGAAQKLDKIGTRLWKVGSADILDFVMLDYLAKTKKPIVFSAGMSNLHETKLAVDFLKKKDAKIAVLHCVSRYPCPPYEQEINTVPFFGSIFNVPVGFSSHSTETTSAIIAVALGATIIEKHFSTNRKHWGADHKVSLLPEEFKQMSYAIRKIEKNKKLKMDIAKKYNENIKEQLQKNLQSDEAVFRPFFRKSLMAGREIKAGETITPDMLYAMRPQQYAGGLPSEEYENVIGKTAVKDLKKYNPINYEIIK